MRYITKAVIAAGVIATIRGLKDQGGIIDLRVSLLNAGRNYAALTQLRSKLSTVITSSSPSLWATKGVKRQRNP